MHERFLSFGLHLWFLPLLLFAMEGTSAVAATQGPAGLGMAGRQQASSFPSEAASPLFPSGAAAHSSPAGPGAISPSTDEAKWWLTGATGTANDAVGAE